MKATQEYIVECITRCHTGHVDWVRPYALHQESCVKDVLQLLHQLLVEVTATVMKYPQWP